MKEDFILFSFTWIILGIYVELYEWFLLNDPTWSTILFYVFIYILTLFMFRAHRAHHQERQIVSIQPLVAVTLCRWPCRVHTTRPLTATRGCIDTICLSWWWARCARNMYRVKNINKYIEKNCASRWSFYKNHYMMHGQQNIKAVWMLV